MAREECEVVDVRRPRQLVDLGAVHSSDLFLLGAVGDDRPDCPVVGRERDPTAVRRPPWRAGLHLAGEPAYVAREIGDVEVVAPVVADAYVRERSSVGRPVGFDLRETGEQRARYASGTRERGQRDGAVLLRLPDEQDATAVRRPARIPFRRGGAASKGPGGSVRNHDARLVSRAEVDEMYASFLPSGDQERLP